MKRCVAEFSFKNKNALKTIQIRKFQIVLVRLKNKKKLFSIVGSVELAYLLYVAFYLKNYVYYTSNSFT